MLFAPPPSLPPFFLYLDRSDTFLIFYDPRSGSNAYCFNGEVLLNNFSTRTNVCGGRRDGKRIRARKVNALSEEERDHFSLLDEFSRIERENRELPRRLRCHGCHDVSNDVWSLS